MNNMGKFILPILLILAGLASGVYLYQYQTSKSVFPPTFSGLTTDNPDQSNPIDFFDTPRTLPAFSFLDVNDNSLTLNDFRGKLILLNIWATWCPPCLDEMPSLDRLQASVGSSEFQVIPLSTDAGEIGEIKAFYDEVHIKRLNIFYDPDNKVSNTLKIVGLPTTFLINRQGKVLGTRIGFATWDSQEFINFIREKLKPIAGQ